MKYEEAIVARGGINKALVQQARETIQARGDYPSIDTVRIELGNTGSKTTIHRYLKELEEEEGSRLDDQALLSDTLKEMVSRLAARLQEEAKELVAKADEQHELRAQEWAVSDAERQQAITAAEARISELEPLLAQSEQARIESERNHQAIALSAERLAQQVKDLEALLAEKNTHVQSLEEKHRHARDAMGHYRESVKEQREQDQRRHEQQVQQLHAEQRQLNQTLSIKRSDITQLNTDNARLVAELSEARKRLAAEEARIQQLERQGRVVEEKATTLAAQLVASESTQSQQIDMLDDLDNRVDASERERQQLEIELAALRAELSVKNQIFEKMRVDVEDQQD
jgi:chromosome segregation ATPase